MAAFQPESRRSPSENFSNLKDIKQPLATIRKIENPAKINPPKRVY
jgi:hypothetical protein